MEDKEKELRDAMIAKSLMAHPGWKFLESLAESTERAFIHAALEPVENKEDALMRLMRAQVAQKYWAILHRAVEQYAAVLGPDQPVN